MNLLKSLITVSSITILSRVLGFIRDVVIARTFGTGIMTDAFFISFKLSNLLRRTFSEGSFSQVFIPVLIEYKRKYNKKTTRDFFAHIFGILILVLIIITLLGILIAPWIVIITAPGFSKTIYQFHLTIKLLRITFPYILLVSLATLAGSVLNIWNYFYVPVFAPVILNITMIIFVLFLSSYFNPPVISLAWSTTIGGILQLLYQFFYLKKINMLVLPKVNIYNIGVIQVIKKMGSVILGISISHVSLIINTIFSSFLISGSVSWMYYADRLIEFPLGVLGVTLGNILLPSLSENFSSGKYKKFSNLIDWGLRLCFLLSFPSAIALGILAKPLIVSLFQYGKFTEFDSLMIQKSLIAYSVGFLGLIIVKILAPVFYSQQDVKTPMKISIITLVLTQLMNLALIVPLKHVGLSLSISFSAYINSILLYWQLYRKKIFVPKPGWIFFIFRILIATSIMAITLISILYIMPEWSLDTMFYRLFRLGIVVIIGGTIYFLSLILLGFKVKEFFLYI